MVSIKTKTGYEVLVDPDIKEKIGDNSLNIRSLKGKSTSYAQINFGRHNRVSLHRWILDAKDGEVVDHINGDGLDNRRENIRICTHKQNCLNHKKHKHGVLGYIGVGVGNKDESGHIISYRINIHISGEPYNELWNDLKAAAMRRDQLAYKYHGEFARLNFPKTIHEFKNNKIKDSKFYCKGQSNSKSTSKFYGVSYIYTSAKGVPKYRARFKNRSSKPLQSEYEAALIYDQFVLEGKESMFKLNFPIKSRQDYERQKKQAFTGETA